MLYVTARFILVVIVFLAAITVLSGYSLRLRSWPMDIELIPRSNSTGPATPQRP